jgi:hypothetical protein
MKVGKWNGKIDQRKLQGTWSRRLPLDGLDWTNRSTSDSITDSWWSNATLNGLAALVGRLARNLRLIEQFPNPIAVVVVADKLPTARLFRALLEIAVFTHGRVLRRLAA